MHARDRGLVPSELLQNKTTLEVNESGILMIGFAQEQWASKFKRKASGMLQYQQQGMDWLSTSDTAGRTMNA